MHPQDVSTRFPIFSNYSSVSNNSLSALSAHISRYVVTRFSVCWYFLQFLGFCHFVLVLLRTQQLINTQLFGQLFLYCLIMQISNQLIARKRPSRFRDVNVAKTLANIQTVLWVEMKGNGNDLECSEVVWARGCVCKLKKTLVCGHFLKAISTQRAAKKSENVK